MTQNDFDHEAKLTAVSLLAGIVVLEACPTYAGPVLGQDNAEVYGNCLGYTAIDLNELRQAEVI